MIIASGRLRAKGGVVLMPEVNAPRDPELLAALEQEAAERRQRRSALQGDQSPEPDRIPAQELEALIAEVDDA